MKSKCGELGMGLDYMPESYILPNDKDALMEAMGGNNKKDKKFYIIKPTNDSQGRGI